MQHVFIVFSRIHLIVGYQGQLIRKCFDQHHKSHLPFIEIGSSNQSNSFMLPEGICLLDRKRNLEFLSYLYCDLSLTILLALCNQFQGGFKAEKNPYFYFLFSTVYAEMRWSTTVSNNCGFKQYIFVKIGNLPTIKTIKGGMPYLDRNLNIGLI